MGGMVIELEKCPHLNCGVRFSMHLLKNLTHQDTVHQSVILYSCGACRACFVTEEAFTHHVIRGHSGPVGFEVDMNEKHGEEYILRVPFKY